jgi:hypothetical protein
MSSWVSMLHGNATFPWSMSMLHVHATLTCYISMLQVFASMSMLHVLAAHPQHKFEEKRRKKSFRSFRFVMVNDNRFLCVFQVKVKN